MIYDLQQYLGVQFIIQLFSLHTVTFSPGKKRWSTHWTSSFFI